MKHFTSATIILFIIVLVTACKNDAKVQVKPEEKKPIVIKEITFPDQNNVTTPPPTKPSEIVEPVNLKQTRDNQQRRRDNNIKVMRQQLRQNCLRGLKERPILKFTVHADGSISSFSFVNIEDQNTTIELDKSIMKCASQIIKNSNLGVLDIELPNAPKMKKINVSLPM